MSNSIKDAIAYIYTRKGTVSDRDEDEGITLYTYKPYDVIQGFEVNEKGKRKFFANDGTDYSYIEDIIEMGDDYVYAFPYYLYKDEKEKADAISDELFERFEKSEKYMLFQLYNDNSSTIQTVATTDQSTFSTVDVSTYDGFNNMLNAEYKAITPEIKALCVVENKEDKAKNVNNGSTSNINTNGMYDHITSSVICQDSQIRSIVTGFAKNQRINEAILHNPNLRDLLIENKQNFLVCGPTGVGKTAIFNSLASYANVPMIKEDSTQYTMEGYVGQSIIEVLKNIYKAADGDLEKAQQGIIVMDEFDKKAITYKSGARGLKQAMNEIFNEAEFEIFGERTPREVIITKESITNPSKLVLKY